MISACSDSDVAGTYYNTRDKNSFIKLMNNGDFELTKGKDTVSGEFTHEDDTIILTVKVPDKGVIRDDVIVDSSGAMWKKK